ncbi:MAG: cbb3-type cytochrome c oxidase subunit II [Terracidiphilus sp.]
MWNVKWLREGWRGAALVACSYVYFLIFAQFAFLKRLDELGLAAAHLKTVMAAMAVGGVLLSLLTPRWKLWPEPAVRLRAGFAVSALAAFLSLLPLNPPTAIVVSFLIGAGLGIVTVTLATHLSAYAGAANPLLVAGLGTGVGYLACNAPPLFTAAPQVQAIVAVLCAMAGVLIAARPAVAAHGSAVRPRRGGLRFVVILAGFAALVWLDSAAFFIIQNTAALKAGTWSGTVHLWVNGILHLAAALASAVLLRRKGLIVVLGAAFVALAAACLLLAGPGGSLLASLAYPLGVSLYSVALVAFPSLLAPAASAAERGRMAGWLYAVAGWAGSAMGIGMAQKLGQVPPVFVAAAGTVVMLLQVHWLWKRRRRELLLVAGLLAAAYAADRALLASDAPGALSAVERGRQVYISEGCIHCHSQYVRPNSPDVAMWGPVETIEELRSQHPPLIGNRRQGPDLTQVGLRRSPLWLKAHFLDPREVSGASIMPSFAVLFRDGRGDDLVAYLGSLRPADPGSRTAAIAGWRPAPQALGQASAAEGEQLYNRHCATCHEPAGVTRRAWSDRFRRQPTDLVSGPFRQMATSDSPEERVVRLARIAKFGIAATDMPGHEYLSDRQVSSLGLWLSRRIAQPGQTPSNSQSQ